MFFPTGLVFVDRPTSSLTHWLPVFSCLAFSFSSGIFSAHDLRDLLIFVWFVETFAESYVINLNLFQTRQRLCILCGTDGVSSSLMVRAKTDDFPRRSQIVRWYVARISGAVSTKNAMYFGLAARAGAPLWKVIPTNPKLYIGLFTETREKISSGNCAKKSSIIYCFHVKSSKRGNFWGITWNERFVMSDREHLSSRFIGY